MNPVIKRSVKQIGDCGQASGHGMDQNLGEKQAEGR